MVLLESYLIVEILEANLTADMACRVDLVVAEGNLIGIRSATDDTNDRSSTFERCHCDVCCCVDL